RPGHGAGTRTGRSSCSYRTLVQTTRVATALSALVPAEPDRRLDLLRQQGDGWILEQPAQRNLHFERAPDAGEDLGGLEGMAPQVEEAVVNAHFVHVEDLPP